MKSAPTEIGGGKVRAYTAIDHRHRSTGGTRHLVAGAQAPPAVGLAICQYEGDTAFYLFGCDSNWRSRTDTWHETLDDAKRQAEFEYAGTSQTWVDVA